MVENFQKPAVAFGINKAAMHPTHGFVQVTDVLPENRRMIKMPNPHPNPDDPQDAYLFIEVNVAVLKPVPDPFGGSIGLKLAHDAHVRGQAGLLGDTDRS